MATQSYRERTKAARAEARAKRLAEEAARRRRMELMVTARMMALEAVKLTIRDRGEKVQHYKASQLRLQAEDMMGPWLILKAKERIAERNAKHLSKSESPAAQAVPLNESHAQNGASR